MNSASFASGSSKLLANPFAVFFAKFQNRLRGPTMLNGTAEAEPADLGDILLPELEILLSVTKRFYQIVRGYSIDIMPIDCTFT